MPGARRNAKSNSFKHHSHSSDDRHSCEMPAHPQVVPPKHIPIPDLPPSSELYFEIYAFLFCLLTMCGQYVNLYRSVFWLPSSHSKYALNYYLIDCHVLLMSIIMIGRRLPVSLLKQMCCFFFPTYHSTCADVIRVLTVVTLLPMLLYCIYNILVEYGAFFSILVISYPIGLYLMMFGPTSLKFLELRFKSHEQVPSVKGKSAPAKNVGNITHVCSMSAETVREEVQFLKDDFNSRLAQVLFNAFLVVFYASFLPWYFAPKTLYCETVWISQHGIFTGIGCFTLYASHCFPTRYCDVLHRSALHLGRWQRVEIKNVHVPYSIWSESTLWNQGALVKHSKELFKAEGISNAAEPGDSTHYRFYALFKNPSVPIKYVWFVQLFSLFSQLFLLIQSYTWNHLISMQLLILLNCRTMYTISKVFFVSRKIYYEENLLISKFTN